MNIQNILYAAVVIILAPCSMQAGLFQTAHEKAQAQLQTINTELDKGYLPIQEICKLNVHELCISNMPDPDYRDFHHMLHQLFTVLNRAPHKKTAPNYTNTHNTSSQSSIVVNVQSKNDEAPRNTQAKQQPTHLNNVQQWIRSRLYTRSELPNTCRIGLDLLDYAIEDLDNLIDWISFYKNKKIQGETADSLIKKARLIKDTVNTIDRNAYSPQAIPDTSINVPFWTQWKLRNRSLSRATYGIITIPRLIGVTLAAGIGYGTYYYATSQ